MTTPGYIAIPSALMEARGLSAYDKGGLDRKNAFHRQGVAFLRKLGTALGLAVGAFDVRSNKGGPAVSGEVTLHSDDLYLQLSESSSGPGVQVLYRTCNGRKDCCGHQNRYARMTDFVDEASQARLVSQLRDLIGAEHRRKVAYAQANQVPFGSN